MKYSQYTIWQMLEEAHKYYFFYKRTQANIIELDKAHNKVINNISEVVAKLTHDYPSIKPRTIEAYVRGAIYIWTNGKHGRQPKYTPKYIIDFAKDIKAMMGQA